MFFFCHLTQIRFFAEIFPVEEISYLSKIVWNTYSYGLYRVSYHGVYDVARIPLAEFNMRHFVLPLNVIGRTGIIGRGKLDEYGPNHCVDVVLTRPIRDADGNPVINETTNL